MIASPYFWIALLAGALAISGGSYYYGGKHARDAAKAAQFVELSDAVGKAIAKIKTITKELDKYEATREKVRVVYRTIKEKADANIDKNPGYAECGLDADGLRLYNARPADIESGAPIPDNSVPGSPPGVGREAVHDPEEQHREG
ncbi:hypothetical protein EBAPG3_010435 [Nitrosospira lacus]|uniref:Uncharacterized protein n=1 Tax=Nitrosospira lacus TaxID=1288494 RepID=A0A1W6SQU9_9PROT|nr:hypothetical protein [Nitrosospira lacus]ARO88159.1 hypothetical protein EBAPG3_010435 [Nitrosospira lacus]